MAISTSQSRPILHLLVFGIDSWLRRWKDVKEFSEHPQCIFRIGVGTLDRDVQLGDGTCARSGDRVIDLHLWNEHIPKWPAKGASIAWAVQMRRCVDLSLRELAKHICNDAQLEDISVIRAIAVFGVPEKCAQLSRLCSRLGFQILDENEEVGLVEQVHRFGENILVSLLVLAVNRPTVRSDTLRRTRVKIYLSRKRLLRRFKHSARDGGTEA
jgi:hypothetical protein